MQLQFLHPPRYSTWPTDYSPHLLHMPLAVRSLPTRGLPFLCMVAGTAGRSLITKAQQHGGYTGHKSTPPTHTQSAFSCRHQALDHLQHHKVQRVLALADWLATACRTGGGRGTWGRVRYITAWTELRFHKQGVNGNMCCSMCCTCC